MLDWPLLLLTLIGATLIGYILGQGRIKVVPPPPTITTTSITSSSSSSTSSNASSSSTPSSTNQQYKKKKNKDPHHHKHERIRSSSPPPATAMESPSASSSACSSVASSPATSSRSTLPNSTLTMTNAPSVTATATSSLDESNSDLPVTRSRRSSSASSLDEDGGRGGYSKRIVIVAKQLPILTRPGPDGKFVIEDPLTGDIRLHHQEWEDNRSFLSGLRALREDGFQVTWVGVPNTGGAPITRDEQEQYEELLALEDCVPVFMTSELHEKFFNGFCKGVLWPMLHYVLPQSNQQFSAQWDDLWQSYNAANAAFSTVISRCVESPTDTIWVHNYHLLLLPSLLRRKLPRAKIGIFIHTPFPSSDVFRVLPTRHNILSSIMAADLLGFHTFDYARHFLSCIKRVMDLDFETLPGGSLGIKYSGRFVSILISHVGIDSKMFYETREDRNLTAADASSPNSVVDGGMTPPTATNAETIISDVCSPSQAMPELRPSSHRSVAEEVAAIKKKYGSRRIIISAGDLDSVKGGLLKFQAYQRFFERFPQWRDSVVFIEMLLPNRSVRLDHVQDLGDLYAEEVDIIQKQYGKECLEVMHLKQVLPLHLTVAYYAAADVCIASQFWDGLNLLPFEYTASQRETSSPGALIISEFMGCSRALSGVLRVNPWNLDDVAEALDAALNLSPNDRLVNHQRRYKYVMDHTILRWARVFLQHLDRATKLCEGMSYVQVGWGSNVKLVGLRSDFTHLDEEAVTAAYRRAERRVLLLDYDGTLTPAEKTVHKSRLMGPSKAVRKLLRSLTSDPENVVFIMSGRTRSTLTEWFPTAEYPELGLAAEKGLFLRFPQRLAFACRQDVRRDPTLKRRVEQRYMQIEVERKQAEKRLSQQRQQQQFEVKLNDHTPQSSALSPSYPPIAPIRTNSLTPSPTSRHSATGDEKVSSPSSPSSSLTSSDDEEDETTRVSQGDAHLLVETEATPVDDTEWEYMIALDDVSWKSMALEIIRSYTEQTDGSWIEDKERAIVWHYEQADPEYGRMQASELQKYLIKILANPNVDVVRYDYNRILEVKPHGVSKGLAATAILEELFMMHAEKLKNSRPPSPNGTVGWGYGLGGIEEGVEFGGNGNGGFRSNRTSFNNLANLAGGSTNGSPHATGASMFQPTSASALPPFLFCVGDDRSDEDMFLSVQNKDYLECKLRSPPGSLPLPSQDASMKRSVSAVVSSSYSGKKSDRYHHHHSSSQSSNGGRTPSQDIDEKTARERRKARIADPFTYTVCVGMKPSNAHYYLHDDEEVVRLLTSLALSSQRMAQTRAADIQSALASHPGGSPIATGANVGTLRAATIRTNVSGPNTPATAGANVFTMRPADIPTSPPLPQASLSANLQYGFQHAVAQPHPTVNVGLKRTSFGKPSSPSSGVGHKATSESESELDSEDEEFLRQKKFASKNRSLGGMRRAL